MVTFTITVDNISNVLLVFSRVQLMKYTGTGVPPFPINISDYVTINTGIDQISNRNNVSDVLLNTVYNQYYFTDPTGGENDWYISRYTNDAVTTSSSWFGPLHGQMINFNYNPLYPSEIDYSSDSNLIINRIRLLIGDPIGLERMHGSEVLSYLHADNTVFQLEEKGWPCSINIFNTQYVTSINPTVNGYKFLRFSTPLSMPINVSDTNPLIDIWYYTFRFSNTQIMAAYNNCYPPSPLTTSNCTADIYMLQTAYDLLNSETWEAISEDGVIITENKDSYNPTPGLNQREKMLARLKGTLDNAIKAIKFSGISGVRID